MLYGHASISAYTPSNIAVWMTMAFQAGVINIGAFIACRSFVSHVTGFATLFGQEIAERDYTKAVGLLAVPILFLIGAMISGLLVDIRLKLNKNPRYYVVFGVIFLLLLFVVIGGFNGLFGKFGVPYQASRDFTLMALLCLVCGIQNGSITSVSKAVVRTTHMTGIVTDLGIGIVRVFHRQKIPGGVAEDVRANWMRVGLILFFTFGSIVGGFVFIRTGFRGFLLPTAISGGLFLATLYMQWLRLKVRIPVARLRPKRRT
ncbi:MAG: DUF1275 domain-containing protein [Proteobacteria bacterium]|nr:MAG: DUF1275 domain-containing protein [Pseudomonadota bacterium]